MSKAKERREKRKLSARKRAVEHKSGFESSTLSLPDGVNFFNISKPGIYRIDIIPYEVPEDSNNPYAEPGSLHFERTYWIHRNIGPENISVVCPKKSAGERCPICEYRAKIAKEPDTDEDLVRDLSPKERQLWNVFDHDDAESGVQVWDFSYHLFGKQLDARIKNSDEEDGYEFFADPEEGMTLKVGMTENNFAGTTFHTCESIDFKRRAHELDEELLEKATVLDNLLIIKPYEELKKIFLQVKEEEEEEEVEEKPKKERKEKKKTPTADDYGIMKGDDVLYQGKKCTVMKISPDGTSLTLVDDDDELYRAVGADEVRVLDDGDDEEEEEKKPVKSSRSSKSTKSSKKAEEEEEEKEEDDEWDDDWSD